MPGLFKAVTVSVCAATSFALAAPPMVGLYRAGELGVVELSSAEGRISARYRGGGACGFKPDMQVISGQFEGDVFLGTVFVCQDGPSCEKEKAFPFLAVAYQGSLAGDVKLDVGCTSKGLETKRLTVSTASPEDRLLLGRENGSSASSIANKNANKKLLQEQAATALTEARVKWAGKNFVAAHNAVERSISYDDSNWETWSLSGGIELELKNYEKGLQSMEKAVMAARSAHLTDLQLGDLFYNLSCAQSLSGKKREALSSLRNALKVGDSAQLMGQATTDSQLNPIRDEPEFRRIMSDAKSRPPRRPR